MKLIILAILLTVCVADEIAITHEYTDYLKKHVKWEVAEYNENIFRGWTTEEIKGMLNQIDYSSNDLPTKIFKVSPGTKLPASIDWRVINANCVHEIRNYGACGAAWAFSAAGVTSDRCCIKSADHGWLSPQELVSCFREKNGCNGAVWEFEALDYVVAKGLVHEACFPYVAKNAPCPNKCADGKDWVGSHVCQCKEKILCQGAESMKACLQTGPVTADMDCFKDFLYYKSGIYHYDLTSEFLGILAIRCLGYSDSPEPHYTCANSWGTSWGDKGFFKIGNKQAGIDNRFASYCDPLK